MHRAYEEWKESLCERGKCKGSRTSKGVSVCKRLNGWMVVSKGEINDIINYLCTD